MNPLENLQGKGINHKLGDAEVEIKPVDTPILAKFSLMLKPKDGTKFDPTKDNIEDLEIDEETQAQALSFLLDETLKESIPESTPEQRKGLDGKIKLELIPIALEVNGLKKKDKEENKESSDHKSEKTAPST